MCKQYQIAGDDGYTLALKPMGRVNQSLKQRVSVIPQYGALSPQKYFKKRGQGEVQIKYKVS